MNIDWSKAPEDYPIWLEDLHPRNGGDMSGWHRDDGDRYTDADGNHWKKRDAEDYYAVYLSPEWTGEGLPPVGTICHCGTHGRAVEVLKVELVPYVSAACRALDNSELFWGGEFSPIRTPEQIAAEEREKAAYELASHVAGYMGKSEPSLGDIKMSEYLYDQGCRLQVTE